MDNLASLSDGELIERHKWLWIQWINNRKRFGELGAPGGPIDLEEEARRRGIPDDVLMAAIPEPYR